jgi:flagellar hook assembly protein FlgD
MFLLRQLVNLQTTNQAEYDSAMKKAKSIHQEQYEHYKQLQRASEITDEDLQLVLKNPNPANTQTTLAYQLPIKSKIEMDVYNIYGDKIKTVVTGEITEGDHMAIWDNRNAENNVVESGIYLIKFSAKIEGIQESFQRRVKLLILN